MHADETNRISRRPEDALVYLLGDARAVALLFDDLTFAFRPPDCVNGPVRDERRLGPTLIRVKVDLRSAVLGDLAQELPTAHAARLFKVKRLG